MSVVGWLEFVPLDSDVAHTQSWACFDASHCDQAFRLCEAAKRTFPAVWLSGSLAVALGLVAELRSREWKSILLG
jgi:hypothetical protein